MNTRRVIAGAIVAMALVGVGCARETLQKDFGSSVRLMKAAQIAPEEKQAARQTSGMDGEKMGETLRAYRQDVSKPQEIRNEITVNVGQ